LLPSASIVKTSKFPPAPRTYANRFPSADQAGSNSSVALDVMFLLTVPSERIVKTS